MRGSKTIWVLLLTLGLIGFMGGTSVVMAGQTDPPHKTHLDDLRGPGMGGGGSPCLNCHTGGSPGTGDINLDTCSCCHSAGGAYDGVDDPDVGAKNNWQNIDNPEGATVSMIYDSSGAIRPGKEKWCATCHDLDPAETGIQIEDFEAYTDDASLQVNWARAADARLPLLELSGGPDGSQYMNLRVKWERTTNNYGAVKRTYDPYIDLTGMGYVNFYVKITAPSRFTKIRVKLIKYPGGEVCSADSYVQGDQVYWQLVSVPRSSFNDTTWELVSKIVFVMFEYSSGSTYEESVCFDNIYFSRIEPLTGGEGPNVVGDNQTYGYYITGHNFRYCTWCHDPTSAHIDGESLPVLEYIQNTPNPTNFRLYDDPTKGLTLPYNGYDDYVAGPEGSFALCYWCHSETSLIGDTWGDGTNFVDQSPDRCGLPPNLHYLHVVNFSKSPWPASCVHCHDPHGQFNPAMTRKEMGNAIVFDANGCEIVPGADSDEDGIEDRHDPDVNEALAILSYLNDVHYRCDSCHSYVASPPNEPPCDPADYPYTRPWCLNDGFYLRSYEILPHTGGMKIGPDCFAAGCHTVSQNHATHFVSDKGPRLPLDETGCYYCHADGRVQCADGARFKNVVIPEGPPLSLDDTTVCDSCHN